MASLWDLEEALDFAWSTCNFCDSKLEFCCWCHCSPEDKTEHREDYQEDYKHHVHNWRVNVNLTDSPATCMGGDHIGLNCITCCMPSLSSRIDYLNLLLAAALPLLIWSCSNKAFSSTKPDAARCWIAFHVNNHPLLYIFQRFTDSWDITWQMILFQLCHSVLKWRPLIYFQIKSAMKRTWSFLDKIFLYVIKK